MSSCVLMVGDDLVRKISAATLVNVARGIGASLHIVNSGVPEGEWCRSHIVGPGRSPINSTTRCFEVELLEHPMMLICHVGDDEDRGKADAKIKEWLAYLTQGLTIKPGNWTVKQL